MILIYYVIISNMRDRNTKERVKNTTHSGVVLTNFEMFGNMVKHCILCLRYLLNQK